MSLISSVAPNGIAAGPLSNLLPIALVEAQGAAAANPTARLLPIAVTGGTLVPAYAEMPRPPGKPSIRLVTSQPSSALAAQLMAQSPEMSPEEIALFARREPAPGAPQSSPQPTPQTGTAAILTTLANATAQGTPVATAARETAQAETRANTAPLPAPAKRTAASTARGLQGYQYVTNASTVRFSDRAVEAVG